MFLLTWTSKVPKMRPLLGTLEVQVCPCAVLGALLFLSQVHEVHSYADFWSWFRLGFLPLAVQHSWAFSENLNDSQLGPYTTGTVWPFTTALYPDLSLLHTVTTDTRSAQRKSLRQVCDVKIGLDLQCKHIHGYMYRCLCSATAETANEGTSTNFRKTMCSQLELNFSRGPLG